MGAPFPQALCIPYEMWVLFVMRTRFCPQESLDRQMRFFSSYTNDGQQSPLDKKKKKKKNKEEALIREKSVSWIMMTNVFRLHVYSTHYNNQD